MTALEQLLKIKAFGRQVFSGQFFSVKYRKKVSPELTEALTKLKHKYPELQVHVTTKDTVIYGGTFSTQSNFMYEVKLLVSRR